MSSDFPFSVRSQEIFFFFLSQQGEKSCVFAVSFVTLEEGISDFITRFNYLRFYGTWKDFFLEEREYGS